MGCASNDTIEIILKNKRNEIEKIKKEIKERVEEGPRSIVFRLMNGKKYSILCFNDTKLYDVFLLLIDKAKDSNYAKLSKLKFYYNSVNITNHFLEENKEEVSILNLSNTFPIIDINE